MQFLLITQTVSSVNGVVSLNSDLHLSHDAPVNLHTSAFTLFKDILIKEPI